MVANPKEPHERRRPQPVRLSEYAPFPFIVEQVELQFLLDGADTRVGSKIRFAPNPAAEPAREIFLHGKALELISARIDGEKVTPG